MNVDWALLRFPFDDTRWKGKFAIGGLLYLIAVFVSLPFFVLMLPVYGFGFQIMRAAAHNEERRLPEWDGWGKLFSDGLKVWVVNFVYNLPITLIVSCFLLAWMATFFGALGIGEGRAVSSAAAARAMMGTFVGFYALFFVLIGCVALIGLPLQLVSAVATSRMAHSDKLSSAFEFGEIWALIKRGFPNYLMATVVIVGASALASFAASILSYTIVLSCLYPFALGFLLIYRQILSGQLYGMAYYHTMGGKRQDVQAALEQTRKTTAPLNIPKTDHPDPADEFATMPGVPSGITSTMMSEKTPPTSINADAGKIGRNPPRKKAEPLKKRPTKKPGPSESKKEK